MVITETVLSCLQLWITQQTWPTRQLHIIKTVIKLWAKAKHRW